MDSIIFEQFNEDKIHTSKITALHNDAVKILELHKELNSMVNNQQEQLNIIEKQVDNTQDKIDSSNITLNNTEEIKKTTNKRYIWISVLLTPIIYLLLL
jgi:t-SNARE complex subunit (syntaxin)